MVDMKQLGESIVEVVKTFVAQQIGLVTKRIDALHDRLDGLRTPQDGKDGIDGKDGVDGKSVELPEVEALVLRAVVSIPVAKDGTSVTIEDVAPLIADQVKAAVAEIPPAVDGKDADPAAVAELVRAEVAKIPAPADGKSVTAEDVAPLILQEVAKAVESIPLPKDGKDAKPVDIGVLIKEVLELIPLPEDGKSIEPADVEPMLEGLVSKAVSAIPKPKDGESVPVDQVQRMIDDAVTKAIAGIPLPKDGKDGEDGRDALELEVLSMIDESKRYRRGTYASHNGGFWRATKTTEGMDGWSCIVDGVAAITVSFFGRSGFVNVKKASGPDDLHPFTLPAMIYRGVFRDGDDYEQGDTVTWGGSLWFCNERTKDKPMDGIKSWQLAAKRGRDGKDGRDGIDFTKAVKLS